MWPRGYKAAVFKTEVRASKTFTVGSNPTTRASLLSVLKGSYYMSRFTKSNFLLIIKEIEKMESRNENIWVPIGILEYMYDDDIGLIDQYFSTPVEFRNAIILWNKILANLNKILT